MVRSAISLNICPLQRGDRSERAVHAESAGECTGQRAVCVHEVGFLGHARRCTQEDYLIRTHATRQNVIKQQDI